MSLNNDAWSALFAEHHILEEIEKHGQFNITAKQIARFREPRLMTKFDHKVNLPKIFADNALAILPITRGSYVISSFEAYRAIPEPLQKPQKTTTPSHLQSLSEEFITSESIALNYALATGILGDFLGDEKLTATVNGRMGSGSFDFEIDTKAGRRPIMVRNSQIEIDAAYEGSTHLALFEAKCNLSEDLIIRQLYYPFRVWSNKIHKPIKSIFLLFSNGVFYLYEYRFEDFRHYNSLMLTKAKSYVIDTKISKRDLVEILEKTQVVCEPSVPFPQADKMERIINLIELLHKNSLSKEQITTKYAFDARQSDYYANAGQYLGIVEKYKEQGEVRLHLSALGRRIMSLPHKERQLAIAQAILEHRVFREALKHYLQHDALPDIQGIVTLMQKAALHKLHGASTLTRRAGTVASWTRWIIGLLG